MTAIVTAAAYIVAHKETFEDLGKAVGLFSSKMKYYTSSGDEVFPTKSLLGWGHSARFKEAIINDTALQYFEYPSGPMTGHNCQVQVISPAKYKDFKTDLYKCDSAGAARAACIDELKKHINIG